MVALVVQIVAIIWAIGNIEVGFTVANRYWFSHPITVLVSPNGAVFLQIFGWLGTREFCAGCISDTEYQQRAVSLTTKMIS